MPISSRIVSALFSMSCSVSSLAISKTGIFYFITITSSALQQQLAHNENFKNAFIFIFLLNSIDMVEFSLSIIISNGQSDSHLGITV